MSKQKLFGQKQSVTMNRLSLNKFEILKTTNVFDTFPGDFVNRNEMTTMVKDPAMDVNMVLTMDMVK